MQQSRDLTRSINRVRPLFSFRLPLNDVSAETRQMVMTVKERKPNLIFLSETWSVKEGREIGVIPASQPGSVIPNSNLDYMFFKFPRMSTAMRMSSTASRQPL